MTKEETEYLLLAGAGIIVTLIGAVSGDKVKRLKKSGITVEGIVFSLERDQQFGVGPSFTSNNSTDYFPVIRFQTTDKEWVMERYHVAASRGVYNEGDKVKVIYNPDQINEFILDDKVTGFMGYFLWIGLAMVVIGMILFEIN